MKLQNEFTVDAPVQQAWDMILDLERVAPCLPGAAIEEETGEREYKGAMVVKLGPATVRYGGTVKIQEADESQHRAVIRAEGKDARGQGTASATIVSQMAEEGGSTRVKVETDMQLTGRVAQFGRGVQQDVAAKLIDKFAECLENEMLGSEGASAPAAAVSGGQETAEKASSNGQSGEFAQPLARPVGESSATLAQPARPAEETGAAAATTGGSTTTGAGESERGPQERPKRRPITNQQEPEPLDLGEASRDAVVKRLVPVAIGVGVVAVVLWLWRRSANH